MVRKVTHFMTILSEETTSDLRSENDSVFELPKNHENRQKPVISVFFSQKPWANQQGRGHFDKTGFIFYQE